MSVPALDERVKTMLASPPPDPVELTKLFVEHFEFLTTQVTIPARAQLVSKDTNKRLLLQGLRGLLVQDGSGK